MALRTCTKVPPAVSLPWSIRCNVVSRRWAMALSLGLLSVPRVASGAADDFYNRWPYAEPKDILPFLYATAAEGDPQSVLDAIDEFSNFYPMFRVGPIKGHLIEEYVRETMPNLALEVGTFLGYSAIRIARSMPPDGRLLCVEADPRCVRVATDVIRLAGVNDKVTIHEGIANQILPRMTAYAGMVGLVFEDHCKECYLPDLQLMEELGLVSVGTTVIADNVVYPGAPDFLRYVKTGKHYRTKLVDAEYEYSQPWNPNWGRKQDALSISYRIA